MKFSVDPNQETRLRSFRCQRALCITGALIALLAAGLVLSPRVASAQSTLVANDSASPDDCSLAAGYTSIQAAVDAAEPGDTVFVCPGQYAEQIVIQTSGLTLLGSGADQTVVEPASTVANTNRPPQGGLVAPILLVNNATDVHVADLTVDGRLVDAGAANLNCGQKQFDAGIYYRNSSGTIDNVHVTHIESATACSFAMLVHSPYSPDGPEANVTITNSSIDTYGTGGIACIGQHTYCTVTGNKVAGQGPTYPALQLGVMIRAEASGEIRDNTISDHFYTPGNGLMAWSVGVFLAFADPSLNPNVQFENTFVGNQFDVQRRASAAAWD